MVEWIGIACVAWTAAELLRMSFAALGDATAPASSPRPARDAAHRARAARPGSKRFAAWDDRGRPIDVEDLGTATR